MNAKKLKRKKGRIIRGNNVKAMKSIYRNDKEGGKRNMMVRRRNLKKYKER